MDRTKLDLSMSLPFKVVDGELSDSELIDLLMGSGGESSLSNFRAGTIIDSKYQVRRLLGEGGMGSVFHVEHVLLHKEMALKTFRSANLSAETWQRFQREAQALGKLKHPSIIQVFDFGISEQNFPYYTMELLAGESLFERLERNGRLTVKEAIGIFIPVADALAHAHRQGIFHRDIKPANIFLSGGANNLVPKVVDFGLAKLATQNREDQSLTAVGVVFGSPLYMSPEQSRGRETDARTDIYSFGCTLFHALAGDPPFLGDNPVVVVTQHQKKPPPQLVEVAPKGGFSERLEAVVARLLAKDINSRFQTFEDVVQALEEIQEGPATNWTSAKPASAPSPGAGPSASKDGARHRQDMKGAAGGPATAGGSAAAGATAGGAGVRKPASHRDRSWTDSSGADQSESAGKTGAGMGDSDYPPQPGSITEPPGGPGRFWTMVVLTFALIGIVGASFILRTGGVQPPGAVPSGSGAQAGKDGEWPFYSRPNFDGPVVFHFPNLGDRLGLISWEGQEEIPASGEIVLPAGKHLHLTAGPLLMGDPTLFHKFRPADLSELKLPKTLPWAENHLAALENVWLLQGLDLSGVHLVSSEIQSIGKLTNLVSLNVSDTGLSGSDLQDLTTLNRLSTLCADGLDDMGPLLGMLKNNPSLIKLSLQGCGLTDDDLIEIGTMRHLTFLSIDLNPVTIKGLRHLKGLDRLETLEIEEARLGPEVLEILSSFPALRRLRLQSREWMQADKDSLRQIIPQTCQLEPPLPVHDN